jgi:hypothetical protein
MADVNVSRLTADIDVVGGDSAVAELDAVDAAADDAARDRTSTITFKTEGAAEALAAAKALQQAMPTGANIFNGAAGQPRDALGRFISMSGPSGAGGGSGGSGGGSGGSVVIPGGGSRGDSGGGTGSSGGFWGKLLGSRILGGGSFSGGGGHKDSSLRNALYGSEDTSFLGKLMSPATMLGTLFSGSFGSLASMAGFGPEHLLTTGLGIGGLAVGGAAGGGLLAGGAAMKSLIGSGSDALVSKTLDTNVKNVTASVQALTSAEQEYGVGSTEATQAQAALNATMAAVPAVARPAVLALATALQTLKTNWQNASAPAQVAAAGIKESMLGLATNYIPQVAAAALQNFGIIGTAIKPLLSWLEGPQGHGIFANLETEFAKTLPTSIAAFTQAVELVLKTLNYASTFDKGNFMEKLLKDLTKLNGAEFMTKVEPEVRKLIGDFRIVTSFLSILGKVLIDVFKNDAGTATSIIELMTSGLKSLDGWIDSIAGKDKLKNLFAVHRTELLTLMKSGAILLQNFGKAYLGMAPTLVVFTTNILKLANAFYAWSQKIPGIGKLVSLALVLVILESRSKTLSNGLRLLRLGFRMVDEIAGFAESIGAAAMSLLGLSVAEDEATVSTVLFNAALGAGILVALVGIAIGVYELVKHFGALRGVMIAAAAGAVILAGAFIFIDAVPIVALFVAIGLAIVGLIAGIVYLATHWKQVWTEVKAIFDDAMNFIKTHIEIVLAIPFIGWMILVATKWKEIWTTMKTSVGDFVNFFVSLGHDIEHVWDDIVHGAETFAKNLIKGLVNGIKDGVKEVVGAVKDVGSHVLNAFKDAWHILSPSKDTYFFGTQLNQGTANGIIASSKIAVDAAAQVATDVLKAFSKIGGVSGGATAVNGLNTIFGDLAKTFKSISTSATNAKTLGPDLLLIEGGLNELAAGSNLLVNDVKTVSDHWTKISSKSLDSLPLMVKGLDAIGKIFTAVHNGATYAARVGKADPALLYETLGYIAGGIPALRVAIDLIDEGWKHVSPKAETILGNIVKGIQAIDRIFKAVVTGSGLGAKVGSADMALLTETLTFIAGGMAGIKVAITTMDSDSKGITPGNVNKMVTVFKDLGTLFTQVKATAGSSTTVNAASMKAIQTAVGALVTAVQNMPTGINTASTRVLNAFKWMGGLIQNYFNGTLIPQMERYGERMMTAIVTGMQKGTASVVTQMNTSGSKIAAAGSSQGAGVAGGLQNNYYIESVEVAAQNPAQFAQQMQQKSRTANATGGSKRS